MSIVSKSMSIIGFDKKNHFISAYLGYYLLKWFLFFFIGEFWARVIATSFVGGYAIYKEFYNDLIKKKGKFELLDLFASLLPIINDWVINEF